MNSEIMDAVRGRPITRERRLDKEVRCYDLLDSLEVEYWRVDHEPAETMELCNDQRLYLDNRPTVFQA